MAASAKYAKYDSAVDDIISIVRRSHFGKPVDDKFLSDIKSLMENRMIADGVMEPALVKSILNTEFDCLPLPNEILVKIFGYLNIQEIGRSAKVSHQFNEISKDSSLWQSWAKIRIDKERIPTEFLTYIIQRGITELCLYRCEILPPRARVKLTELKRSLNLKTLCLDQTKGDKTLVNEILTSHPMEKVDLELSMMSKDDISQFIKLLPQIGSQLKSLKLNAFSSVELDLTGISISLIVDSCRDLEELNIRDIKLSKEAISYLCENLTPTVLKLDISTGYCYNDNNIRRLVERCPKLKVLDIRFNGKFTYQGLVAITDGLHFLEVLGLPRSFLDELGFPDNINLSKLRKLRSLKKLEELFIGWNFFDTVQSILKREIPQLKNSPKLKDIQVATTNTDDYRRVKFSKLS